MEHISLITENKSAIAEYVMQLKSVFGNALSISPYHISSIAEHDFKSDDIILTSAYSSSAFYELKRTYLKGKKVVPINLSLKRKNLIRLNAYPKGTKALLVNVTKFMAEETITQLYQAGYSNLEFTAWYPGAVIEEEINLAITPEELSLVPNYVTETINIGPRQIDILTIVELAVNLKCEYVLETNRFLSFFEEQFTTSTGFSILMKKNQAYKQRLSALIQMFPSGVIGINSANEVFDLNYTAASLLNKSRSDILGMPISLYFSKSDLNKCRSQQITVKTKLLLDDDKPLNAVIIPIIIGVKCLGVYAIITPTSVNPNATSSSVSRNGHIAKYRFADICGNSKEVKQTIELGKKMARTDSSVLITGESGTGKELFAHAIHNNSSRANGPFVAINCAALPENLLESELFGYEEGAFTGAKKGGKIGLFELANSGSIFLDEIEGMTLNTQLKLLRVIQEREIMRIGGDKIIPIDVRIISASNQELLPMIHIGTFRQDLFYRVSTLPLDLPPLRFRKDDILLLIEEFKKDLNLIFTFTEEVVSIMTSYSWPGNIRELRNCIEYLGCHNIPVIEVENLPFTIIKERKKHFSPLVKIYNIETEILSILSRHSCGRKILKDELLEKGIFITEGQLRGKLEFLKENGWISSGTGREGSKITSLGINEYSHRVNG